MVEILGHISTARTIGDFHSTILVQGNNSFKTIRLEFKTLTLIKYLTKIKSDVDK